MADPISGLIETFRSIEPRLVGDLRSEWATKNPDHRISIRRALKKTLNLEPEVEDLNRRPSSDHWSISISHCGEASGWIAIPSPARVGLDLENRSRIRPELIDRISKREELRGVPDPAFLWVAKESFYKALDSQQPPTITQLFIDGWMPLANNLFGFSGQCPGHARGFISVQADLLVSVCMILSVSK